MLTPVLTNVEEAVSEIKPGSTVGIGSILNSSRPMAFVREIVRREIGDLHIVGLASGLEVDMLIAAGLVRRVSTPTVSAEGLRPIAPAFQAAVQYGEIEVWECDEEMILAALQTLDLDVALCHVSRADIYGNVQPQSSDLGNRAMARAAKRVFCSSDRIVGSHEIRSEAGLAPIARVDNVVHAPFGAHPFASPGRYIQDVQFLRDYLEACENWTATGNRWGLDDFFDRWISGPAGHFAYLSQVGPAALYGLEEGLNMPGASAA